MLVLALKRFARCSVLKYLWNISKWTCLLVTYTANTIYYIIWNLIFFYIFYKVSIRLDQHFLCTTMTIIITGNCPSVVNVYDVKILLIILWNEYILATRIDLVVKTFIKSCPKGFRLILTLSILKILEITLKM